MILRKIFILFLLILILIIPEIIKNNNKAPAPLSERKKIAAEKGINWFKERKDKFPTYDTIVYLTYFYKTTDNTKQANEILEIIKEKNKQLKNTKLEASTTDFWKAIDLLSIKKCINEDYSKELEAVKILSQEQTKICNLDAKIVKAYQLKNLGLIKNHEYQNIIDEVRLNNKTLSQNYYDYLYGITHIVFTKSNYYKTYLTVKDYTFEKNELLKAVDYFSKNSDSSDKTIDIISEVLIALKILKVNPNNKINSLYEKLIDTQHPDGSWGMNESTPNGISHHTLVASLALMPFPKQFRTLNNSCSL